MARVPPPLLRSQKLVKRKKRLRVVKIIFGILFLVGSIYGIWWGAQLPQFTIENIVVEGSVTLTNDQVTTIAESKMQGAYAEIISRHNIIFYPRQPIIDAIKAQSLRIGDVTIERQLWNTIIITIRERVPVAVWCGVTQIEQNPCYVIDREGVIFDTAPEFSGSAYVRLYGSISARSSSTPLGATYGTGETFARVRVFLDSLSTLELQVASVVMHDTDYTVYLNDITEIRLSYSDLVEKNISLIQSLRKERPFDTTGLGAAEYIDLRYGNKIFYKLKATEGTTTAETAN